MDALGKLGIDGWGLLLYLVNFGVLLFLMKRFVYKPLVKMIDERRDRIKDDVERAASMREQLKKERAEEVDQRKTRMMELDERIKEAKGVARDEAKKMLTDAEAQRDAILSHASETADATIAGAMHDAEKEILHRVKQVVTHVLEEGVPQDVVEKSVQDSWKTVTKSS